MPVPDTRTTVDRVDKAALGKSFCAFAALCYACAGLIDITIIASPEFAVDLGNGTHTADARDETLLATGLLALGSTLALAAIVRGGSILLRLTAFALLLFAGGAVTVLTLPLQAHYG